MTTGRGTLLLFSIITVVMGGTEATQMVVWPPSSTASLAVMDASEQRVRVGQRTTFSCTLHGARL